MERRPLKAEYRRRPDEDDLGAPLEHPLELLNGPSTIPR